MGRCERDPEIRTPVDQGKFEIHVRHSFLHRQSCRVLTMASRRRVLMTFAFTTCLAHRALAFSVPRVAAKRGGQAFGLQMVRNRGLEVRREGATPTEGGMALYVKAGEDGKSLGDCPFAHFVRMVLHEKGLTYELKPSTQKTKPEWLIEHYEGKMPALRHRKECYTESDVIAQYLDFFFQEPSLSAGKKPTAEANEAVDGFFPAVARYLKHTPDGDEEDTELKANLEASLQKLETHLANDERTGPFIVGDGETLTLVDCSLAPKLYHMTTGLRAFKNGAIDVENSYPAVQSYIDTMFQRPSFVEAVYPEETIVWGWSNARQAN